MADTMFKVTCPKCGKVYKVTDSCECVNCECGLTLVLVEDTSFGGGLE